MKLGSIYDPNQYEDNIYALWEAAKAFKPKHRGSKESYSLVMPPPNANANIHLGTAITIGLEDIAVRYNRMRGKATLFLPGADHAGIETQFVYEKHLAKEGKSRFDFTRDELYQQIWDFVEKNKTGYEKQFRKLGVSADWDKYVYTLDEKIVKQAYSTFRQMWEDGLIYRGERLVNYCTFHGTGFADIEVEYKEKTGHLWYIGYPVEGEDREVVVATTRPETMLGDVAVAVHPDDKRYKKLIGKKVKLPLVDRLIPIIGDEMVEPEFGTGAVKITPAHDPNDFEVAGRHDLGLITVIGFDGKINENSPKEYQGLSVDDARYAVVDDLKTLGFINKTERFTHTVGHCYKCSTVIEPLLRDQWFVDMQPLAKEAIKALNQNKIVFHPESKKKQLVDYLEGLLDWNISRQNAWGIPIPAFQGLDNPEEWVFSEEVDKEIIQKDGKNYRRDPDVFDTWFSSSSWPYATLGYPDSPDFKQFYPLSLMETGGEILYPWVSRMIMLGLYVTGEVPFKEVYIHGYVMAEDGSKMSKSVGNVVDPLPLIEKFGSDALRMGIIAGRVPAVNRGYDPRKVEDARNFCNKIWNIARFIEDKVGSKIEPTGKPEPTTIADHWILSRLNQSTEQITTNLEEYRFAEGYENLYHLIWDDLADWYIEASKSEPNNSVLAYCLETILKLAHPYAPFLTETIWQTLSWHNNSILAVEAWPDATKADDIKAGEFESIKTIVLEARNIATTLKVNKPKMLFTPNTFISDNSSLVVKLAKLESAEQTKEGRGLKMVNTDFDIWLDIPDKKIKDYRDDLTQKAQTAQDHIKSLEARLKNKEYVNNAPKNIIDQTKSDLEQAITKLESIKVEQAKLA